MPQPLDTAAAPPRRAEPHPPGRAPTTRADATRPRTPTPDSDRGRLATGRRPTARPANRRPPTHPPEPTYPCCLPALGEFSQIAPREGLRPAYLIARAAERVREHSQRHVMFPAEDSPRGLGRTLGKRVGGNPSRVRISYPPPVPHRARCRRAPPLAVGPFDVVSALVVLVFVHRGVCRGFPNWLGGLPGHVLEHGVRHAGTAPACSRTFWAIHLDQTPREHRSAWSHR